MRITLIVEGDYILRYLSILILLEEFMEDKNNKKNKHYVQIGTLGHVDRSRPSLIQLIIDTTNKDCKAESNNNANKQSDKDVHKGIEIKR